MKVNYVLDQGAFKPDKAHENDAGLDLRTPINAIVEPRSSVSIDTGVHIEIPNGCVGLILPKSGLNVKHDLVSFGVIDSGYTGSIVAKISNLSDNAYKFNIGDKITQLVIMPIAKFSLLEQDELRETERGANGFGSSGY